MANLPPDKRSFTLTMNKETYEKIAAIAEKERRSVTFMINELIEEALKRREKK
ncbi:CopG domain protein DNA-binding domain protein [Desulfofarcimen acetoxidans DSM 771]|uniref:CopG domain protein DNA-binding domain protein n=1 Tax=Desulfofarcimen acetoxidans (strain ATCC 49208 / DSM 771 / KCTC 5769 / VKM B-1644 / 5575) TaxID=485916 RepID=C8VWL5_DESAS|nr:ribbon-helix-helix protein, CopG family [Desulfofarcimen acetoxidans]ACV64379.1 CopG domain protein DNA-binding domain protein [Desulfofarcimen acetoxidans DSM 771]